MDTQKQIDSYIASHSEPKSSEMAELHRRILQVLPGCKLWFEDGRDSANRIVSNPTIGYGERTIKYASNKTKESFRIGLSANKTGISIYILGIEDKTYLARTFGKQIGKATVTGYCIRFKRVSDIDLVVLESAMRSVGFAIPEH